MARHTTSSPLRLNRQRRPIPQIRVEGPDAARIAEIAGAVPDPELPMISLANLGVLRAVDVDDVGAITITITPTYSGCPATKMMADDVISRLHDAGYSQVTVNTVLRDAWSSDDVTEAGRASLLTAGIAPPAHWAADRPTGVAPDQQAAVECPLCGSRDTEQLSRFGSTSCKALYRCRDCREPFDYFKVL